jgi:predicted transcriptional regulator
MARPRSAGPTAGELEILQVFWRRKIATYREVVEALSEKREVSDSTIRTMMRLMIQRGFIAPIGEDRPQKFRAVLDADTARDQMVRNLAKRFFGGSAKKMLLHLFSKKATPEQISEAERLLKDME